MGSCYNKIEIALPVADVWKAISDFHDMSWAPGVITDLKKVGEKDGSEIGAQRVLNDVFHETLQSVDADNHTFSYSIDDGPGPVSNSAVKNYIGVVKLSPADNGTLVEWSSSYESANEDEVADFCNPIYSALLSALKQTLS
jgi:carbon monoxide dehydrogenase subunit G